MDEKAPIEEYFPVEKVNEIAEKESVGFLKLKFRPHLYTHLWWARRLGCIFRAIGLYTLADEEIRTIDGDQEKIHKEKWDGEPESLWDYYPKDIDFSDKTILDCFMGGGTTISELRRFNTDIIGSELNPVAWYMNKKQMEPVKPEIIEEYIEKLENDVKEEIQQYYKTICPECENEASIIYTFWVKKIPCYNCGDKNHLFKDYRLESNFGQEDKDVIICPECYNISLVEDYAEQVRCAVCDHNFIPKEGNATRTKHICLTCSHADRTVDVVKKTGKIPDHQMIAIKYNCPHCDEVSFKKIEEEDKKLYARCEKEFEENKKELLFPREEIPDGYNTRQAKNYQYEKFSELFNKRQLITLSKLLSSILNLDNQNVKELFLLSFSKSLESNNMFSGYDTTEGNIGHLFARHDYAPKKSPVENNVWGDPKGARTFENNLNSLKEAMEFSFNPVERYIENGELKKAKLNNKISGDLTENFEELENGKANTMLLCGDSSYLPIPDNSVDAVITDPPYGGNVMYSELADFFYVWLRLALKDEYDYFNSSLSPKSSEVIKNEVQGKDEEDFTEGLTRVFSEANKKLKDEGIMVFTFHHKDTETWEGVLRSVLDSGFYISAVYPVNSEVDQSMLIREKSNIEYDMIVICRKRESDPEKGLWSSMEDKIYIEAKNEFEKIKEQGRNLSQGDVFVITIGKCLEIYSKHYPNVIKDGKKVPAEEALESINNIVETQVMGGMFDKLTEDLDIITAAYLSYIAGRGDEIGYSSLNKNMKQRNLDISDLVDSGIVKKEGGKIIIPELDELAYNISDKPRSKLNAIDRAYYLIYLQERDKLMEEMREWATEKALIALEKLGEKENKDDYKELADFVREKTKDKSLEDFR